MPKTVLDIDRILELGRRGLKLREIHEQTGASTARISEILRGKSIKPHFYLEYEREHKRPCEGHYGRPVKSDFPRGYVTSSEAARILGVERGSIHFLLNRTSGHKLEGYKNGSYQFIYVKSIHQYVDDIFKDAIQRGQEIRKVRS